MRIDIVTLFPELCDSFLSASILGRARAKNLFEAHCHQIRDYTKNKQKQTDDYPYGGGRGAVMQADPLYQCWKHICEEAGERVHTIYLSPAGRTFRQGDARRLKDSYQAVILQSFGVGGLPGGESGPLAQAIGEWLDAGRTIVMMTQVPYEGSDMAVYQVGQQVKEKYQLLEAYNMTLEGATAKLMWVLGQTQSPEGVRALFYRPVCHDLIC